MKSFLTSAFATLLTILLMNGSAQAQYPDKPVRIIVGVQAGASTDALARVLARKLGEQLNQQFIVENKPGASTRLAMDQLTRSAADGYTIAVANAVSTSFPLMFDDFAFIPGKDFVPIAMLGRAPSFLAVRSTLPAKTVQEFVAYAKANNGKLTFGHGGNGTNPHLSALTLLKSLGVNGVEVSYKGNAPTALALASSEIDFAMLDYSSVRPLVESGRVRLLAVTEPKRASLTPNVPTSGEQAITREIDGMTPWFMLVAPQGTPSSVVDKLNQLVNDLLKQPDVRQALIAAGIETEGGTQVEAQSYFLQQRERLARTVRDLKISLRN